MILYILKCEQDKYYVGITDNFDRRLKEHLDGIGSEWTSVYKVVDVIENKEINIDKSYCQYYETLENARTVELMAKYGIDNVRGGTYSCCNLYSYFISSIKQQIKSIKNKCYECGGSNHYSSACPLRIAESDLYTKDDLSLIYDTHIDTNDLYTTEELDNLY